MQGITLSWLVLIKETITSMFAPIEQQFNY
jgi:hypothetical protein